MRRRRRFKDISARLGDGWRRSQQWLKGLLKGLLKIRVALLLIGGIPVLMLVGLYCCPSMFNDFAQRIGYSETSGGHALTTGMRFSRDALLALAAIVGLCMAGWRNLELDRQATAALEGAATDRARLASEQFSTGVKLLAQENTGTPALEARIGGIYALEALAKSRPVEYHAQVMKTLVSYIRNNAQVTCLEVPSIKDGSKTTRTIDDRSEAARLGEDVKTAFATLKSLFDLKARAEVKIDPEAQHCLLPMLILEGCISAMR